MFRRRLRTGVVALVVLGAAVASCSPAATAAPGATSYQEFRPAFCSAWEALFRAVGNPDTGAGSDLSKALDAAIAAGDQAAVERAATAIAAELADAHRQSAFAAGWQPAAPMMAEMDRLIAAYDAGLAAQRTAAGQGSEAARALRQSAFEKAGGLDAWQAMFSAVNLIGAALPAGQAAQPCANVPISI